jgi:hypothetical protein
MVDRVDANLEKATGHGHMTPSPLKQAQKEFRHERACLPRVIFTHMNPPWESAIRKELETLKAALDIEIIVAEADMTVNL